MNQPAVILLVFANDEAQPLNELAKELDALRSTLRHGLKSYVDGRNREQFDVVTLAYSTTDSLFDELRHYRNRIAIIHFAGHTDSSLWQLNEDVIQAQGVAEILHLQQSLKFLFLNGCDNAEQVELFAKADIPAIIATNAPVDDTQARSFSTRFYQHLISDGLNTSLQDAFELAKAEVREGYNQSSHDQEYRTLTYKKSPKAWSWLLKETKRHAAQWSLGHLLRDDCFGLPVLPKHHALPTRPFKDIHYFTEKDAPIFFGRCREIMNGLLALTNKPIQTEDVHLLYGSTGVGKSSFLSAGLIPYLKAGAIQTLYYRYDEKLTIKQVFFQLLGDNFDQLPHELDDSQLLNAWKKKERHGQPLIIILDQLESIFTRENDEEGNQLSSKTELLHLLNIINAIFNQGDKPLGKLVLSFRKEWLAEVLNGFEVANIAYGKLVLESLDSKGIVEAIEGITNNIDLQQRYKLNINNPGSGRLAEIIASDLLTYRQGIAPTLQILLSKMWREVEYMAEPTFDINLYKKIGQKGRLIERHLQQQIDEIGKINDWGQKAYASGLILDVLYIHTTGLGTAGELSDDAFDHFYSHITYRYKLINELKNRFLIVDLQSGSGLDGKIFTRLTHDTLAPLIRSKFRESVLPGQRARRILDWREYDKKHLLDRTDTSMVVEGQYGTRRWNANEEILIKRSRFYKNFITSLRVGAVLIILSLGAFSSYQWQLSETEKQRKDLAKQQSESLIEYMVSILNKVDPSDGVEIANNVYKKVNEYIDKRQQIDGDIDHVDLNVIRAMNERLHGRFLSANKNENDALRRYENSVNLLLGEADRIQKGHHGSRSTNRIWIYGELAKSFTALYGQYKEQFGSFSKEGKEKVRKRQIRINENRILIYREMSKHQPKESKWLAGLVIALMDMGDTLRYKGDLDQAFTEYNKANEKIEWWLAEKPEDQIILSTKASLLTKLGSYYFSRDAFDKAEEAYVNGTKIKESLLALNRSDIKIRLDLIVSYYKNYVLFRKQGKYKQAHQYISQAIELLEGLDEHGKLAKTQQCWLEKDKYYKNQLEKMMKGSIKKFQKRSFSCDQSQPANEKPTSATVQGNL